MRVAILKNRIYKGGVSQVLAGMIAVLNEQGIVPDLVTFRSDINQEEMNNSYGVDIRFNVKTIFFNFKMPYEWNFLFFNWICRFYIKKYDFLINSNNTSFLLPGTIPVLSYVHFPRKQRVFSAFKDYHLPEKGKKSFFDYKQDLFFIAKSLYKRNRSYNPREYVLCNSQFTRSVLKSLFPTESPKVLYPPVSIEGIAPSEKKEKTLVVTLGRFSAEKRQLEQLEIAKGCPELNFILMGFSGDKVHLRKCEQYKKKHNLSNVQILPDLSFKEVGKHLSRATFFLHNVRNEPFGITTVQAIARKCVPVVHNSGGSVEIVGNNKLCFNNSSEAIKILKELNSHPEEYLNQFPLPEIDDFDIKNFKKEFLYHWKSFAEI